MMKIRQTLIPNNHNTTLFYGHQDIPIINYYMPQDLLETLGESHLFYGENPPKILFDSCYNKDTTAIFAFYNQCFGMTSLSFKERLGNGTIESSNTDDTYKIMSDNKIWEKLCLNDTILPIFFDTTFNGTTAIDPEVLRYAYIMGDDPYFTLYYYEVRKEQQQLQPLNAVILSGKVVYNRFPIDTIRIVNDRISRDSIDNDTIDNDAPTVSDYTIVYDSIPQYLTNIRGGLKTMKYFPNANVQTPTIPGINPISFDTLFIVY